MPLASFKVKLVVGQPPVVELNGEPLPPELIFRHLAMPEGRLPTLVFDAPGEVELEGEGLAILDRDVDERAIIRRWIENLDPQRLQDRSLYAEDDPGFNDPRPGAGILYALHEANGGA